MSRIKVAVTGAGGQIGSLLVRRMSKCPDIETVAVCRNAVSAGLVHFSAPGCEIRTGSITEIASAQQLLGDCDAIINCALAMVSGKPRMSHMLNKLMICNLSRLKSVKSIIHLSSISVYGTNIDSKKCKKSAFDRPHPDNDYGRSKLMIERYAQRKFNKKLHFYILRLGHVIGAGMDRSRQIIDLAQNRRFTLPFDGKLQSNCIHVEHLAMMIIDLLFGSVPSGIYNVATEQLTWRQVFNWHTDVIGLPPVKGMAQEPSERLRGIHNSNSIGSDLSKWFRSLPLLSLIRYPVIFDTVFRSLYIMPMALANRLATIYKRFDVRRQISSVNENNNVSIGLVYLSDPMPGIYLQTPLQASYGCLLSEEDLSRELKDWYKRFSEPVWLPQAVESS